MAYLYYSNLFTFLVFVLISFVVCLFFSLGNKGGKFYERHETGVTNLNRNRKLKEKVIHDL